VVVVLPCLGQAFVEPAARHNVEFAGYRNDREPVPPL
jgi:hypothetical protein